MVEASYHLPLRPQVQLRSICVFCGSSPGRGDSYRRLASEMGTEIARRGCRLVFGGSGVGLMREVADAAMAAGGGVVGVIPKHLVDREVAHKGLTDLRIVASMHERKALMAELSDAFVALPGGLGTLEEFFEVWTWGQLGLHRKPYGLLNVEGFFDPLVLFLDRLVSERFLKAENRAMLIVENQPGTLLDALAQHDIAPVPKWIDKASC